jgi:hypothetical protein
MESAATFANILRAKLLSSKGGLSSHFLCAARGTSGKWSIVLLGLGGMTARPWKIAISLMTRVQAWSNPVFEFLASRCFPWMSDKMVGGIFSALLAVRLENGR